MRKTLWIEQEKDEKRQENVITELFSDFKRETKRHFPHN